MSLLTELDVVVRLGGYKQVAPLELTFQAASEVKVSPTFNCTLSWVLSRSAFASERATGYTSPFRAGRGKVNQRTLTCVIELKEGELRWKADWLSIKPKTAWRSSG